MANYFSRAPQAFIMYEDDFSTLAPVATPSVSPMLPPIAQIFDAAGPMPSQPSANFSLAIPQPPNGDFTLGPSHSAHQQLQLLPLSVPSVPKALDPAAACLPGSSSTSVPLPAKKLPKRVRAPFAPERDASLLEHAQGVAQPQALLPLANAANSIPEGDASALQPLPKKRKRAVKTPSSYPCTRKPCSSVFDSKWKLRYHVVTEHDKSFTCPHCGFVGASGAQVRDHIAAHHTKEELYACTQPGCEHSFVTRELRAGHVLNDHGISEHVCDVCQEAFVHSRDLIDHKFLHTDEKFPCKEGSCRKEFETPRRLQQHIRLAHRLKWAACELCDYSSATAKDHMPIHIKNYHTPFTCDRCAAVIDGKLFFDHHRKNCPNVEDVHVSLPRTVFECHNCESAFTAPRKLRYHNTAFHTPMKCPVCNELCCGTQGLKMHSEYRCSVSCADCNSLVFGSVGMKYHKAFKCSE